MHVVLLGNFMFFDSDCIKCYITSHMAPQAVFPLVVTHPGIVVSLSVCLSVERTNMCNGWPVWDSPGKLERPSLKVSPGTLVHACGPSTQGVEVEGSRLEASLSKISSRPYLKTN
jgi:hypothetical protein